MNIKVLYHSSTGNTKKLANAIAEILGITAEPIQANHPAFSEPVDLLFIGDGIYFSKPDKNTAALIQQMSPQTVKNAAVFATYGGQSKIGGDMRHLLEEKGVKVAAEPFLCKGQAWAVANRGRPNESDLQEVKAYAKKIYESILK